MLRALVAICFSCTISTVISTAPPIIVKVGHLTSSPDDWRAVEYAKQKIYAEGILDPAQVQFKVINYTSCSKYKGVVNAATLVYEQKVSLLFGPACSEMLVIGELANADNWNVAVIDYANIDKDLSNKAIYSTLARTSVVAADSVADVLVKLVSYYNWTQVSLIGSTSRKSVWVTTAIKRAFLAHGININLFVQFGSNVTVDNITSNARFKRISKVSRIVIIAIDFDISSAKPVLQAANSLGMSSDDYVFILPWLQHTFRGGNYPWEYDDGSIDVKTKLLYKNSLVVDVQQFARRITDVFNVQFANATGATTNAATTYMPEIDGFFLYALALRDAMKATGNTSIHHDGQTMWKYMRGQVYAVSGSDGQVFMDYQAERFVSFTIWQVTDNTTSIDMQQIMDFQARLLKNCTPDPANATKCLIKEWHYLERFCFMSNASNLHYNLQYPANYSIQKLYLYFDGSSQWPAVYASGLTCSEKEARLHISENQILNLSSKIVDQRGEPICRTIVRNDNENWLRCTGNRRFVSERERWWFLAFGNCNSSRGLYIEYDFTFTNGQPGQAWFNEFSFDEFYVLHTDIVFLLMEITVLIFSTISALKLRARHLLHRTFKIFLVSLIFESISLLFDCVAYGLYAQDGIGMPLIRLFGQFFRAAGSITFLFLLLLLAKGYTITTSHLSDNSIWKLLEFMSTFILTYCALFIWHFLIADPAKVTHLFKSYPAYGLAGLRMLAWLWFCYAAYRSQSRCREKRGFYLAFSVFLTLWFWMGSASIIIANYVLEDWQREKVTNGIENAIALYGFGVCLLLTLPSACNCIFPFHLPTNTMQIGTMPSFSNDKNKRVDVHKALAKDGKQFQVTSRKIFACPEATLGSDVCKLGIYFDNDKL